MELTAARRERQLLADEFELVGPDAPTLCDGWTTRDLAAHIVVRERRPDAAPGIFIKALAGYADKVQDRVASDEWPDLIELVRNGPPAWSPTRVAAVDRTVNTTEFFVHHEDVRRAQPHWTVRELDPELVDDLYGALRRSAKLFARKAPAGILLAPDDGRESIEANSSQPQVTVQGPVGELVLWLFGRQAHAEVTYVGDEAAIDQLKHASFGI